MPNNPEVSIRLQLPFPKAGLVFNVQVGREGERLSFQTTVADITGKPIALTVSTSPQLADWARGYSRWLFRAKVTASHTDSSISGTFAEDLAPEEVLSGVTDACDMIRQRFELYQHSIVG